MKLDRFFCLLLGPFKNCPFIILSIDRWSIGSATAFLLPQRMANLYNRWLVPSQAGLITMKKVFPEDPLLTPIVDNSSRPRVRISATPIRPLEITVSRCSRTPVPSRRQYRDVDNLRMAQWKELRRLKQFEEDCRINRVTEQDNFIEAQRRELNRLKRVERKNRQDCANIIMLRRDLLISPDRRAEAGCAA